MSFLWTCSRSIHTQCFISYRAPGKGGFPPKFPTSPLSPRIYIYICTVKENTYLQHPPGEDLKKYSNVYTSSKLPFTCQVNSCMQTDSWLSFKHCFLQQKSLIEGCILFISSKNWLRHPSPCGKTSSVYLYLHQTVGWLVILSNDRVSSSPINDLCTTIV